MAEYPLPAFYFSVRVGNNSNETSFQAVDGISGKLESEAVIEGGENRFTRQLPTRMSHEPLVLKRAIAQSDSSLLSWCHSVLESGLTERIETANITVGLLDENGQPVLDDDFEKVLEYDVSHVDARVLVKLLDKALPSADGSAKTSITVQNETHVHAAPKPMPQLVRPSMAVDVVDAEFVTENTEDAGND